MKTAGAHGSEASAPNYKEPLLGTFSINKRGNQIPGSRLSCEWGAVWRDCGFTP